MSKSFSQIKKSLDLEDTIPFGKYQGMTFKEQIDLNGGNYVTWWISQAQMPKLAPNLQNYASARVTPHDLDPYTRADFSMEDNDPLLYGKNHKPDWDEDMPF